MRTLRLHLPVLVVALVLTVAQWCSAECAPRPQDTIWMIDTRGAGCPDFATGKELRLKYSRYDRGRWVSVTKEDFLASDDPSVATSMLLHGNQIDVDAAADMGLSMYHEIVAGAKDNSPLRFVIFTWPSERISGGLLNDVRTKAARSDTVGYQLAWLLDQMNPDLKITLIGYSFGARSIGVALELLAGGRVNGHAMAARVHTQRAPFTVVFMAAALDDDWFEPGHRLGQAMSQMDRLLLVNNSCDRVLKRYRWLYCGGCAAAMGYVGLDTSALPSHEAAKVRQYDACCDVGKQHDWTLYVYSSNVMARIRPYVLKPVETLASR
jgi:hypothetical protein